MTTTNSPSSPSSESLSRFSMKGVWAFLIVLFSMPLGHALMILSEKFAGDAYVFHAALVMGFIGVALLLWGFIARNATQQTILGFLGGVLFWTGWVEFAFVYYARRYGIEPLLDPVTKEVITKPEYLIMPSSISFWAMMMLGYTLIPHGLQPFQLDTASLPPQRKSENIPCSGTQRGRYHLYGV